MLEITKGLHLDKVYIKGKIIGIVYLHTGIRQWVFESAIAAQGGFTATSRDDIIDRLLSLPFGQEY